MYWVRPQQILSSEGGMHRFVWDMHYPAPEALNREFPISAIVHDTAQVPLGAWAMPGTYTVKLIVDGKSYTQPLTVRMDPRVKTSEADLRRQFEMESGIVEGMNETYEALQQVRTLRPQLADRSTKAKGALGDSLKALDKQAGELEGASQGAFFGVPPSGRQSENLSTLNQHLGQLLNVVDSADTAPTTQAAAVYSELKDAVGKLRTQWAKVRDTDLPSLNASLKKAHIEEVDLSKGTAAGPVEESDQDDEP
jgi:membrane-associated HD superfamily phosphohydrolase